MKYLSVCSGIEAATVAWHNIGWESVGFSEIEAFPSAVLSHHYPNTPNLGDMTNFKNRNIHESDVNILVGGTPCQSFSVAGLRKGLSDDRGNLALVYCNMADHFNPDFIVWENVPGILSSKDNAFGCFLAGLAGEDEPLLAPRGKWTNAGYVLGPKRAIAWRVLDAQYFGVAQRRRRVFVIGCPRNGADPRTILFESEGVRRDTPPSREKGKSVAGDVAARLRSGGNGGVPSSRGEHLVCAFDKQRLGEYGTSGVGSTCAARDYKDATDLVVEPLAFKVRRLTPTECERLQGFPDTYTMIPWKKKPAEDCPDGPRYKALGNSMAVPVMRWIGERINAVENKPFSLFDA